MPLLLPGVAFTGNEQLNLDHGHSETFSTALLRDDRNHKRCTTAGVQDGRRGST